MEYTGATNVDMGGVVLDSVDSVWVAARGQVGGVDTMHDVSTVCRQLRDGVYRCYECRHGLCDAR